MRSRLSYKSFLRRYSLLSGDFASKSIIAIISGVLPRKARTLSGAVKNSLSNISSSGSLSSVLSSSSSNPQRWETTLIKKFTSPSPAPPGPHCPISTPQKNAQQQPLYKSIESSFPANSSSICFWAVRYFLRYWSKAINLSECPNKLAIFVSSNVEGCWNSSTNRRINSSITVFSPFPVRIHIEIVF